MKSSNPLASDWLKIIYNAITFIVLICSIIFGASRVLSRIEILETDYAKHCIKQIEDMKKVASLDITNLRLNQICSDLDKLFDQLEACRLEDAEFRKEFYQFMRERGPK